VKLFDPTGKHMNNKSSVIDYIDLVLTVPVTCMEAVSAAVDQLQEQCTFVEIQPKLKGATLHINSNDVVTLLGYTEPTQLSQLDAARLKQIVMRELDQQLLRSTSLDKQAHYKWCITAVKNFQLGRHLSG
jgi:hypothetical protein